MTKKSTESDSDALLTLRKRFCLILKEESFSIYSRLLNMAYVQQTKRFDEHILFNNNISKL